MNIINNKLYEKHLEAIQNDKAVRKQLCVNDFATSDLERTVATKSAEITEQIAIEFIEWCNYPMYRKAGNLRYDKRVIALYPTYNRYIIIDDKGRNILSEGEFLTSKELFQEFLKQRQ